MTQCIDGFKHVCNSLFRCFDIEIYKQSGGLGDPELLARETVCMLSYSLFVFSYNDSFSWCSLLKGVRMLLLWY